MIDSSIEVEDFDAIAAKLIADVMPKADFTEGELIEILEVVPRWGGRGCYRDRSAYSVWNHSWLVALLADYFAGTENEKGQAELLGLRHDFHEAIIGDIMTPVAKAIDYSRVKKLKAAIDRNLAARFDWETPSEKTLAYVARADRIAMIAEKRFFFPEWHHPDFDGASEADELVIAAVALPILRSWEQGFS
jgi:5'-deoxynucleotidase YfbR-like HD superfamily hydrolase